MATETKGAAARRVLIICQYFVPYAASVGVVARVMHLAHYLKMRGCEVCVLTSDGADFGDMGFGRLLAGLDVTYLSDPLKRSVQNSLRGIGSRPAAAGKVWLSWLRLVKRILSALVIPDLGILMVRKYYRCALGLIESKGLDTVIVSSPTHSMQLVGALLKNRFGERIDLVADYRDSWNTSGIFLPKNPLVARMSRKLERFCLRRTDILSCASQPMLTKLGRAYPDLELERKGLLMLNGYAGELDPFLAMAAAGELRIGYFGMANDDDKGYRNIEPLLRAVAGVVANGLRVRLCFYGPLRLSRIDIKAFPFVEVNAAVAHGDVFKIMQEMNYLVILHTDPSSSDEVITGKFFDYIKARRPILCFTPENTEAARLVKKWQLGEWVDAQAAEPALAMLAALKHVDYPALRDDKLLSFFSRSGQYQKLYERLAGVG